MKQVYVTVALSILIGSCAAPNKNENLNSEKMETKVELSNKEKANALLISLETGDEKPVSYINPTKYIQHNLGVADGLEGFGALLENAPEDGFKAKVVRSFQDGDYVFTQTEYDFFGPKIGFDIFRFEEGKIVEHWDNLSEQAPINPSGHSQTDGSTALEDLNKTDENKAIIEDFIQTVLINGEFDKMPNYFDGDHYIQHNSQIGDGLSGLGTALEEMAKNGVAMTFDKNHIVLGEGNFVLAVSEGMFAGNHTSFYDLFRLKNGNIVEHWDVIETILPESEHQNNNGKFNF